MAAKLRKERDSRPDLVRLCNERGAGAGVVDQRNYGSVEGLFGKNFRGSADCNLVDLLNCTGYKFL